MKNDKKIRAVVEEARKILNDYPHLKYYEAIHKAKEVLRDELGRKNGEKEARVSK